MKKIPLFAVLFFLVATLSGCANVMTGMPSSFYKDGPLVITYNEPEIIRDQSRVATLIVPMDRYGLMIDSLVVKERAGKFNPDLRVSQTDKNYVYLVDILPGDYKLTVTYDAITGPDGKAPSPQAGGKAGKVTVTGSYSGPSIFSWIRTSETTHTLKGGEIYVIGLKMMTVTGEIDLYSLDEGDRDIIIEARNNAKF